MNRISYREYIDRVLDRADDETVKEVYIFLKYYLPELGRESDEREDQDIL